MTFYLSCPVCGGEIIRDTSVYVDGELRTSFPKCNKCNRSYAVIVSYSFGFSIIQVDPKENELDALNQVVCENIEAGLSKEVQNGD